MGEAWAIDGTYVQACNCDYGCPCNFNARPTPGSCEGVFGVAIDRGTYGQVPLDGLSAFVAAAWPGAIHEGGGTGYVYVDDRADEAQRAALGEIFTGRAGGPIGIIMGTFSTINGPEALPVRLRVAGKDTELEVDGRIRLSFDSIRNPVTGAEVFPQVVLRPAGLLVDALDQFTTREFASSDHGYAHPGKVAQLADLHWRGP